MLDDLPCEILLGEETLEDLDAFNRETSFAMEVLDEDGIELHTIFWASRFEQKMAEVFKFDWKGQILKRKNDAAGEAMHHGICLITDAETRFPEGSIAFDHRLLANVDPQFREWLGEMLAGGQVPSDPSSC